MNTSGLKKAFQSFIPFTEEEWNNIEMNISVKKYKKGDVFLNAGEVCNTMGFIVQGLFRKYFIKDGEEINFWFYHENRFLVAYQSFLQQEPTKFYIEALEDSEVLILSYNSIQGIYTMSEDWERLGRLVCEKMYIESHKRIESLLFNDASKRYNDLIQQNPHIIQRIPQYHLASYLGIKPQSLSRIRKSKA